MHLKGRRYFVEAKLEELDTGVFPLILVQHSISDSPAGSPDTIRTMLNFAAQHHTNLIIEFFRFGTVNEAIADLTGLYLAIPINFGALNN